MAVVTFTIIALTVFISISAFSDREFFVRNLFSPYMIRTNKEWHRFFTHALLHADFLHLGFNMYALYLFGELVEHNFWELFGKTQGELFYALLYIGGVLLSSYPSFEKHKHHSYYSAVGASGAVSAVVFSAIFMHPTMRMGILFLPFMMPAFIFGIIYLVASWYLARKPNTTIGHDAHFWGAIFGIVFTIALKFQLVYLFIDEVKNYIQYNVHGI